MTLTVIEINYGRSAYVPNHDVDVAADKNTPLFLTLSRASLAVAAGALGVSLNGFGISSILRESYRAFAVAPPRLHATFGRLACVQGNDPYIVPLNFSYAG